MATVTSARGDTLEVEDTPKKKTKRKPSKTAKEAARKILKDMGVTKKAREKVTKKRAIKRASDIGEKRGKAKAYKRGGVVFGALALADMGRRRREEYMNAKKQAQSEGRKTFDFMGMTFKLNN